VHVLVHSGTLSFSSWSKAIRMWLMPPQNKIWPFVMNCRK
jgi:hypothetical protein